MLSSILYCLFEAHDEKLCREFGQVFSEKRDIELYLDTLLECHYACYFIAVCDIKRLNVTMLCNVTFAAPSDHYCATTAKYLQNTSTDIASLYISFACPLSHEGMEQFAKAVSTQSNILSVKLNASLEPDTIAILCDSICKHNLYITKLELWQIPKSYLSENDLESIGSLLNTCKFLEILSLSYSLTEEVCLKLSPSFYKGLCETKSLQKLRLPQWWLSLANSKVFGNIIGKNCSLKDLRVSIATADCLGPILNGLSSNTSITTFRVWPGEIKPSRSRQLLKKCFTLNCSLNNIDFTDYDPGLHERYSLARPPLYVLWSSTQVCSICTGLCANTTVVTLDISGCYINTEACHAVCGMFSQNTTLQHLFLNPVQLDKQEAITMIESCRDNDTLKLLSFVQWPPKVLLNYHEGKDPFKYSRDKEITQTLQEIHKIRQKKDKPLLNVSWLALH